MMCSRREVYQAQLSDGWGDGWGCDIVHREATQSSRQEVKPLSFAQSSKTSQLPQDRHC